MLYLLGSIVLNAYLILSFKAVERYGIPVFQAIVFNYVTCVVTGSVVSQRVPFAAGLMQEPWFFWAMLMGTMFITLFNIIGFTAQRISVAVASVANKLSLVIPFVFSLYLYNEPSTALKIAGIAVALVAVLLTCWPQTGKKEIDRKQLSPFLRILLPFVLFLGSGLLDTLIKYVEQSFISASNHNTYLITAFAMAACLGLLVLLVLVAAKQQRFYPKSILAGVLIGVPNYFSIWCLLKALKQYEGHSSALIPINNMGIVLVSSVLAYLLFGERLSVVNWAGILLSAGAIALIAFG